MRTVNSTVNGIKPKGSEILKFIISELKPKGKLLTPFNIFSALVISTAAVLVFIRFKDGLGAVTNLTQEYPWGIWIGFDVITGVAFAGGAYVITFMVYILRLEKYHSIVRVTVLNGFLAYVFYAGALLLDLGKPWNVINPVIGNSFGVSSVMFLVAWHFMLYMFAELVEFSPTIAEWLGLERIKKILNRLTLGAVIFGITLSTLHQSGLGALFLMAENKIHPLWYTEFIPILFFVSSIFAGLSMVILEGSISTRLFGGSISKDHKITHEKIILGLAKVCAVTMFAYLFLKLLVFIHGEHWNHLPSAFGTLYLSEMIGFVILPCILFTHAVRKKNTGFVKAASILTMLGIVLNRLNVSVIAFKWYEPDRYFPSWMEIEITLAIILIEIIVLRWVILRMPVFEK